MNAQFQWSVALIPLITAACAHKTPDTQSCPPCKEAAAAEENRELSNELKQVKKERTACGSALEAEQRRAAYLERWRDGFGEIADLLRESLNAGEDDADESIPGVSYKLEFLNGNLVLTLSNDLFFDRGKAAPTKQGKEIMARLAEAFEQLEGRKVIIGCRSTAAKEHQNHAKWLAVRELSARRSLALMAELEKRGVDPRNLTAASLGNKVDEDLMERGTVSFTIAPSPQEMPKYPQKL